VDFYRYKHDTYSILIDLVYLAILQQLSFTIQHGNAASALGTLPPEEELARSDLYLL